jgi:hypothetical protein
MLAKEDVKLYKTSGIARPEDGGSAFLKTSVDSLA